MPDVGMSKSGGRATEKPQFLEFSKPKISLVNSPKSTTLNDQQITKHAKSEPLTATKRK